MTTIWRYWGKFERAADEAALSIDAYLCVSRAVEKGEFTDE
jgi:hypothetical protein